MNLKCGLVNTNCGSSSLLELALAYPDSPSIEERPEEKPV